MVHVADWPCHGSQYHSSSDDSYPGGDPAGIGHEQMMKEVAKNDVQYWFGYIDPSLTDQMIKVFNESLQQLSDRRLLIRQISAKEPKEMGEAVNRLLCLHSKFLKSKNIVTICSTCFKRHPWATQLLTSKM